MVYSRWFQMEHFIKMGDLGVPLQETSISCHARMNRSCSKLIKALGFTVSLSAHHEPCSPRAKWISYDQLDQFVTLRARVGHQVAWIPSHERSSQPWVTLHRQHRLVHTAFIQFDNLFLPPRHDGDGFWNISCETTTRLRRCFNQTPMSASVASHMRRQNI